LILALPLRPNRKHLPIFAPSDARGRWSRIDQGYRGGSSEVAWLLAWIDAVLSHDDSESAEAAIESAYLRQQAAEEGWFTEAARLLAEQASPELRAAFARADCLDVILGVWNEDEGWHQGLAGLTYMESRATRLSLNGLEPWEIANHEDMLSRRRRRTGETMPVEEVYKYHSISAIKLRQLFGTTSALLNEGIEEPPTPRMPEPRGVTEYRWSQRAWPAPWEEDPDAEVLGPEDAEDEENPSGEPWLDDR